MGDGVWRLREHRWLLSELRGPAGHRQDHPCGYLHPRLPAAARDGHRRNHEAAGPDRARPASAAAGDVSVPSDVHARVAARWAAQADEVVDSHGTLGLVVSPDHVATIARSLKDEFGFDLLLDVTAVDWPARNPRFD